MAQDVSKADPTIVLDLLQGFRCSKVMFAAVSLGVFDALAAGPRPLADLAHQLQANADALERLLDAPARVHLAGAQARTRNCPLLEKSLTRQFAIAPAE